MVEDDRLLVSIVAQWSSSSTFVGALLKILSRRIDGPDFDMIRLSSASRRRRLELHSGVAVFMLHGVLIDALAGDARLLRMYDDTRSPVRRAQS